MNNGPNNGQRPPNIRPLKLWPFVLVGLTSFAIAKISLHPRMHLTREPTGWTLRYDYASAHDPGPADKGLQLPPALPRDLITGPAPASGKDGAVSTALRAGADDGESNTRWILDTGATGHMCTNRSLMHAYRELPWGQTRRGFMGANGQVSHLVGVGDVTLDVAIAQTAGSGSSFSGPFPTTTTAQTVAKQRVTLSNVHFYPTHGVNILSWSQLKASAARQGVRLRLVEGAEDWSLRVVLIEGGRIRGSRETEKPLMRFRMEGGLFVLDQPPEGAAKIGQSEGGRG